MQMDDTPFSFEGFGELAELARGVSVPNSSSYDLSVLTADEGNTEVVDLFAMLRSTESVGNAYIEEVDVSMPVDESREKRFNLSLNQMRSQPRKVVPSRVKNSLSNAASLARKERTHRQEFLAQERGHSNAFLWLGSLRDCNEVLEPTATSLPCSWHPLKPFYKSPSYVMVVPGQRTGGRGPLPMSMKATVTDLHSYVQTKKQVRMEDIKIEPVVDQVEEQKEEVRDLSTFSVTYNVKTTTLKIYNTQDTPITIRINHPEAASLKCANPVLKIAPLTFSTAQLEKTSDVYHEIWNIECAETVYKKDVLLSSSIAIQYPKVDILLSSPLPAADAPEMLILPKQQLDKNTTSLPLPVFTRYLRVVQELVESVDTRHKTILHACDIQGVSDFLQQMPYTKVSKRVLARLLTVLSRKDSVQPVVNGYIVVYVYLLLLDIFGNIPRWSASLDQAFPLPLVPVRQPGVRPNLLLNAQTVTKREQLMVVKREMLAAMLRQAVRGVLRTVQHVASTGTLHTALYTKKMRNVIRQANVTKVKLSHGAILPPFTPPVPVNKRKPVVLSEIQQDQSACQNLKSVHGFTSFHLGSTHAAASTRAGGFFVWPVLLVEEDARKSARGKRDNRNVNAALQPAYSAGVAIPYLQGVPISQVVCAANQLTFLLTEDGQVMRWPPVNPDTGALKTQKSLLDIHQSVWTCKDTKQPPSMRVLQHFDHLKGFLQNIPPLLVRSIAQNVLSQIQPNQADAPLSPRGNIPIQPMSPMSAMRGLVNRAKLVSNQALYTSALTFYNEQTSILHPSVYPKLAALPLTPVSPAVVPTVPYLNTTLWAQAVLYTLRAITTTSSAMCLPLKISPSILNDTGDTVVEPLLSTLPGLHGVQVTSMACTSDPQIQAVFFVDNKGKLYACGNQHAVKIGLVPCVEAGAVVLTNFSKYNVTKVACGPKHVVVCTREGCVLSWGQDHQPDLKPTQLPTTVPSLSTAGKYFPTDLPWETTHTAMHATLPLVPPCLPLSIALTADLDTSLNTSHILNTPFNEQNTPAVPFTDNNSVFGIFNTNTIAGTLPSYVIDVECSGHWTVALTKSGACYSNEQGGYVFAPVK